MTVWFVTLKPGKRATLPPSKLGAAAKRALYLVEAARAVTIGGRAVPPKSYVTVRADAALELANPTDADMELLVLGGKPIGEPVAQHGPFVMNTRAEIMQAFADYQRTQFGGWPWPQDAMVFPRDQGRFAQRGLKAEKEVPGQ